MRRTGVRRASETAVEKVHKNEEIRRISTKAVSFEFFKANEVFFYSIQDFFGLVKCDSPYFFSAFLFLLTEIKMTVV